MREIIFCVIFYAAAAAAKEGNVVQEWYTGEKRFI